MTVTSHTITVATEAPVDEIQTITITATGGTFTASKPGGTPTDPIDFDATSAALKSALVAAGDYTTGDLTITGDGPHAITYTGDYAGQNLPLLDIDDTEATGGTVTIDETTPGSPRTPPVRLDTTGETDARDGTCIYIRNTGDDTAYLGGPDVTTTTGLPLAVTTSLPDDLDLTDSEGIYATTADGDTASITVLETGT